MICKVLDSELGVTIFALQWPVSDQEHLLHVIISYEICKLKLFLLYSFVLLMPPLGYDECASRFNPLTAVG